MLCCPKCNREILDKTLVGASWPQVKPGIDANPAETSWPKIPGLIGRIIFITLAILVLMPLIASLYQNRVQEPETAAASALGLGFLSENVFLTQHNPSAQGLAEIGQKLLPIDNNPASSIFGAYASQEEPIIILAADETAEKRSPSKSKRSTQSSVTSQLETMHRRSQTYDQLSRDINGNEPAERTPRKQRETVKPSQPNKSIEQQLNNLEKRSKAYEGFEESMSK
jgi:hypothetical protein